MIQRAKKSLGQNFLMHPQIARRIVHASGLLPGDAVLEIGPGRGMLTRALLEAGARVLAVETDPALIEELQKTFPDEIAAGTLILIHDDIRNFDPSAYPLLRASYSLVANIPYYITGEIIRTFLTKKNKPTSMTILVQKEVAKRIVGNSERSRGEKSKKESILSLSVKVYGIPSYEFTVPKGAFVPKPNVDSAVLKIRDIKSDAFESSKEEKQFFTILKAGFAHPRKYLARNLEATAAPKTIQDAFERVGISTQVRAEDVPLQKWQELARAL